jgi:hypothetical protein
LLKALGSPGLYEALSLKLCDKSEETRLIANSSLTPRIIQIPLEPIEGVADRRDAAQLCGGVADGVIFQDQQVTQLVGT